MAKRTYDELLKEYGLERKETDFERDMKTYGSKIQAGIEASKKRNAELAKDVDKRRAEYEAKKKASSEAKQKAANEQPPKASKKSPVASATTVRQHKGGGATAEVDTERIARQKAIENMVKKEPSAKSQTPKKTSEPRRVLSSSDSEAQKERAAEGAKKTTQRALNAIGVSTRRYYDAEARAKARRARRKVTQKRSSLTIASLRNEYQQELMKKHKKETSGK